MTIHERWRDLCVPLVVLAMGASSGCSGPGVDGQDGAIRGDERVLADGLENPFEVALGPDGWLWVTERTAKRVTRVSPEDGRKAVALTLEDVLVTPGAEDGLLGLAFDPALLQNLGKDFVYLAYTYDAGPGPSGPRRRLKVVRFTYDGDSRTLSGPQVLLSNLPASTTQNAGRLRFGPDQKLYYAIGDQGANERAQPCAPNRAQDLPSPQELSASDWSKYQGKVLRLNSNGTIPDDNPLVGGVRSHIYSFGHRDPTGLAFSPDGSLYVAEQGPKTDDELNLIEAGKNYGWPAVAGFQDDRAYEYGNWSSARDPGCEQLAYSELDLPPSVPRRRESEFLHADFRPPLRTFQTVDGGHDFRDPRCAAEGTASVCWPTLDLTSLASWSTSDGVSLLMTSAKDGAIHRLRLGGDRLPLPGDAERLYPTVNRYRDLELSADGATLYVATDSEGFTLGAEAKPTSALEHPGSILRFSLTPR